MAHGVPHVLIIDDDAKLRSQLEEYLSGYGFGVSCLPDGNDALQALREKAPDMVILDVMMPGKDGMEVLREMRRESPTPVIMLTAKGDDTERIVGLELGADDYLPKPFNPRELLARIRAVLRRASPGAGEAGAEASGRVIELCGLRLHTSRSALEAGGEFVDIGQKECEVLAELMRHPDATLSRDDLMDRVWGRSFSATDRNIDVAVSKIRLVLRRFPGHGSRVRTVWGTGYKFSTD